MAEFAKAGDFCPNPDYPDYEQAQKSCGNIIKFGHTRSGRQRYKCKTRSRKPFSMNRSSKTLMKT